MKTHYAISFKRSDIKKMKAEERAKQKLRIAIRLMSMKERRALFLWLDGDTDHIHEFIEMIASEMPNSYDDNQREAKKRCEYSVEECPVTRCTCNLPFSNLRRRVGEICPVHGIRL